MPEYELNTLHLRVKMLEDIVNNMMVIIGRYARDSWVRDATKHYEMFLDGDTETAKHFAEENWEHQIGRNTKDFGYPIPPAIAEDAVESDVSYWSD